MSLFPLGTDESKADAEEEQTSVEETPSHPDDIMTETRGKILSEKSKTKAKTDS